MSNPKLTDSEIMEALKHCANGEHCRFCCFRGITGTVSDCSKNFLDLINRQKAEKEELVGNIDRLKAVKRHIDTLIHRNCEYPTAETYNKAFQKALESLYDKVNIKAEAYKEFAERLKAVYEGFDDKNEVILYSNLLTAIDCLLIGMVGDK